jgi:hypothetical protein
MTITLSYPEGRKQEEFINFVVQSCLAEYNEFELRQLSVFAGEIITRIASIIDSEITDSVKRAKLDELRFLLNKSHEKSQDLLDLEDGVYHALILDTGSSSSYDAKLLDSLEELELYVKGDEETIKIDLKNKNIELNSNQKIERLQAFVQEVAKQCITGICEATQRSEERPATPRSDNLTNRGSCQVNLSQKDPAL